MVKGGGLTMVDVVLVVFPVGCHMRTSRLHSGTTVLAVQLWLEELDCCDVWDAVLVGCVGDGSLLGYSGSPLLLIVIVGNFIGQPSGGPPGR